MFDAHSGKTQKFVFAFLTAFLHICFILSLLQLVEALSHTKNCEFAAPRPKIKDDGTVDLKAKDMSLSQIVWVRNDGSGRLAVGPQDCSFDVREISVKFHGGARSGSVLSCSSFSCVYQPTNWGLGTSAAIQYTVEPLIRDPLRKDTFSTPC